jgi:hypothetical protein
MSETTSAPAAPAAPAAAPESAPPPDSQPAISVSEAARLLNQQRRQGQPPPPAPVRRDSPPTTPAPRPSGQQAAPNGQQAPAAPTPPAPAPAAPDGADTMARALGLPDGAAPPVPSEQPRQDAPGIEVDGRRLSHDEVRRAVAAATDYTQKTQALARERQALEQQQQALATVLPYLQPELARIQQQIAGVPRPDAALIESNPQEYLRQRAAYEAAADEQGRLGQLTQVQQEAAQRALAEQVQRGNEELAKEFPQWADPQIRAEWQRQISEWAMGKAGFNRQELSRLADHRQLKVMMKAYQWDRMMDGARTGAPIQSAPPRGVAPPPAPAQRVSDAESAFEARPNFRNAAALLGARRAR